MKKLKLIRKSEPFIFTPLYSSAASDVYKRQNVKFNGSNMIQLAVSH